MIKLFIADDHKMIRDGIKSMILHFDGVDCVGEATNGNEVIDQLKKNDKVDVILIDINMPDMGGIECTKEINRQFSHIKVLALSMNSDHHSISRVLKAGALGYILKDCSEDELLLAITKVSEGENFFSSKVTESMMSSMIVKKGGASSTNKEMDLSQREIEIIQLIAGGLTNIEIGEKLFISPRTVDTHRRNLLQKTGAKNSAELVKYAALRGLITDDNE